MLFDAFGIVHQVPWLFRNLSNNPVPVSVSFTLFNTAVHSACSALLIGKTKVSACIKSLNCAMLMPPLHSPPSIP